MRLNDYPCGHFHRGRVNGVALVALLRANRTSQPAFATPRRPSTRPADAAEAIDTAAHAEDPRAGRQGAIVSSPAMPPRTKPGAPSFARLAAEKLQIRQDAADRNTIPRQGVAVPRAAGPRPGRAVAFRFRGRPRGGAGAPHRAP